MVFMSYITLLGDSIIDNKIYVQKEEFSVLEHLENITEYEFTQIAYDGHTTHDVLNSQLLSPSIDTSSHIVLSIGGNDLLSELPFLYENQQISVLEMKYLNNLLGNKSIADYKKWPFFRGDLLQSSGPEYQEEKYEVWRLNKKISELELEIDKSKKYAKQILEEKSKTTYNQIFQNAQNNIFKPLEQRFETIIQRLSSHRANLLLCTVYEGDLRRTDEFRDVLDSSKIMVSSFNDTVYKTASKYNADVLELRHIFTSPKDYANPIEPSHIGGEKLAQAITDWIQKTS